MNNEMNNKMNNKMNDKVNNIMNHRANNILEFNIIRNHLSEFALSEKAKEKLLLLQPFLSESECNLKMDETTQAVKIIECLGSPPLASMTEIEKALELSEIGAMLNPEQLTGIYSFIASTRRMRSYLKKAESLNVNLAYYGASFADLSVLAEEIDRSIRNNAVDDGASASLRDTRRKIETANTAIKSKLESILRSKKEWFADGYVTTRSGRFVVPVKKEYKHQVGGSVIDISGSGSTYFIEPTAVGKLQEKLSVLQIDEDNEIRKILYTLTALVHDYMSELNINMDCMESLDFAFAKAKYSLELKGIPVPLTTGRKMMIKKGRHPLLNQETCVPLDFEVGGQISGVVITGPNTGGKTVALKTIGLLSLMAQSGLHVPAAQGSIFSMHCNVLCDIGDGQSITENLSTFSSHITNIISILENVTNESLVLLDELGSGTDPAEGMGLAVSILEELRQRNCLFVATTHYPEIKGYAAKTERLINARMEFDRESLKPLYQLQIGEAGESCALYIASKLGFPAHMLKRAHMEAYSTTNKPQKEIPTMEFAETPSACKGSVNRPISKIKKAAPKKSDPHRSESFQIGDSVTVLPDKSIGLIYREVNDDGNLGVQIKGKKQLINHKRIKLLTPASQLYPDDYDFSIIFDSVENRKARHKFGKGHQPGLEIHYSDQDL